MASAEQKAISLKDSYVDSLVKNKATNSVQNMPETDYGEVALDPVTAAIGIGALGAAAVYHLPELTHAISAGNTWKDELDLKHEQKHRGAYLLNNFTGLGPYKPNKKYD